MIPLLRGRGGCSFSLIQTNYPRLFSKLPLDTVNDSRIHDSDFRSEWPGPRSEHVSLSVPAFMVWGANTGVGKTLLSAALARWASLQKVCCHTTVMQRCKFHLTCQMRVNLHLQAPFLYLTPVQTGFPADSDAALVVSFTSLLSLVGHMVPPCNSMYPMGLNMHTVKDYSHLEAPASSNFSLQKRQAPSCHQRGCGKTGGYCLRRQTPENIIHAAGSCMRHIGADGPPCI